MACIKPIMMVNNFSRIINKLETSLTDNARVIIHDCHMFIVLGTGLHLKYLTRLQGSPRISSSFWQHYVFTFYKRASLIKVKASITRERKRFYNGGLFSLQKHLKEVEEKQQSSDLLTRAGILARERARKRERRERKRESERERKREKARGGR